MLINLHRAIVTVNPIFKEDRTPDRERERTTPLLLRKKERNYKFMNSKSHAQGFPQRDSTWE